jgi:hypothetical protein
MSHGRLRLTLAFHNQGSRSLAVGFEPAATYLSDDHGVRYKLLSADWDPRAEATPNRHRETLAAGADVEHWIEFSRPKQGARTLMLVLASDEPRRLRYRPLQVELPARSMASP